MLKEAELALKEEIGLKVNVLFIVLTQRFLRSKRSNESSVRVSSRLSSK